MARAGLRTGTSHWPAERRPAARAGAMMTAPPLRSAMGDPELTRSLAAFGPVLDAIATPVLVVSKAGEILCANTIAQATLAGDGAALRRWLGDAVAGATKGSVAPTVADWELIPIGSGGATAGYLALRRTAPPQQPLAETLVAATRRWKLTTRQAEVLELVARGLTNDLIAETLGIGRGTVEFHLTAIFDKTGVCNRATLIVRIFGAARG